jgi:hypothetical protein
MRKTLEKCWEQNIDIPQLFIDCQAEYDTPWRKKIWSEMHKLCFPRKNSYIVCSRTLSNEIMLIKLVNIYSLNLMVNIGLRKGDAIARLLFTTLLDTALEKSTSRNKLNNV